MSALRPEWLEEIASVVAFLGGLSAEFDADKSDLLFVQNKVDLDQGLREDCFD